MDFQVGEHRRQADAEVAVDDLLGRHGDAERDHAVGHGLAGKQFAVDQDAVAVEDEEGLGEHVVLVPAIGGG